ncbi:aluminum-activated malate transporter 13-like isoform X9 [Diospyros lotus]|uniref:aluminum-activated malate transporter 13-like isoform X2 n=1 Tax=Diospyros lotus TaxID=55363 RepID=UPI002252531B|nr:aluminum-activated malate transporter 13-like isoform X2 [Diospyros lotus]XP_052185619.1 aluminum-activated malate transporter 13-like isoform X3 [Diospyros lotus]XP_052185620.1 aluminum-activated malate transporter 13-like isoform X4 [Diospyros lotus]XP_052185621.1 aluminum-activated malate transporter 13-like isoform X5 [Diospyros lotus]XP_052185622.1 aluminum-activated malate transporter 13-like isoform X6 [Diospyros lotus]XP_052185623.1 aluminum-activated malate transporter 13-like isof
MQELAVLAIPIEEDADRKKISKQTSLTARQLHIHTKVIHSAKVGMALLLVSLLMHLLDPVYNRFRDHSTWALITVVVIFQFSAGATLGKGLNRVVGTVLGGGLGCLAALLADKVGGIGNSIVTVTCVFVFGTAATYCRLAPSIKRRYDYGAMICILTFNLVLVSDLRANEFTQVAFDRLLTIGLGLAACIATSLLIFPVWSGDELHLSTAANFEKLSLCIQECLEGYFGVNDENGNPLDVSIANCQSVINSKSNDESLVNFARWEPWHGKFGFTYPWDKYLPIGDDLRELAATIITLKGCLQSSTQPSSRSRERMKEPCRAAGSALRSIMGELGESVRKMARCKAQHLIDASKLQSIKVELIGLTAMVASSFSSAPNCCKLQEEEEEAAAAASDDQKNCSTAEGIAMAASFLFLLLQIAEKMEVLAKEVEELGELAGFRT